MPEDVETVAAENAKASLARIYVVRGIVRSNSLT
jgi:hypothetical protein